MFIQVEKHPVILASSVADYAPTPVAQITDITVPADVDSSLAGKSFYVFAENDTNAYQVWYNTGEKEISTVDTSGVGAAALTTGDYFELYSANDVTKYLVWYNIASGGGAPTAGAGEALIQVDLPVGTEADTVVATNTASAINGNADFSAPAPGATLVTITNANFGNSTNVIDSVGAPTTFAFATTTGGTGSSSQPPRAANVTQIMVDISPNDTATAIATATATALAALADFGAGSTAAVITVTNADNGRARSPQDVNVGITFDITTSGAVAYGATVKLIKIVGTYLNSDTTVHSRPQDENQYKPTPITVIVPEHAIINVWE